MPQLDAGPYGELHSSDRIKKAEFKPCDTNDVNQLQRFRLQKLTRLVEELDDTKGGYCQIDGVDALGENSNDGIIPRAQSTLSDHYSESNDFDSCKKFCTEVSSLASNDGKGFLSASESSCYAFIAPNLVLTNKLNAAVHVGISCTCSFKEVPVCGSILGCTVFGPNNYPGAGAVTAKYSDKHHCFKVDNTSDGGFVSFLNCAHQILVTSR